MILEVYFIVEYAEYFYLAGSVRQDVPEPFTVTITVRLRLFYNLYPLAERHLKMMLNSLDGSALENIVLIGANTHQTVQQISECYRIVINPFQQDRLIVHDNA